MPKTTKSWTITGLHNRGTLVHPHLGTIHFGDRSLAKNVQCHVVNLVEMEHGGEDSADKAVPCFIAAADLLNKKLRKHREVAVHCGHGNSRTSFALITFLVRHAGFSYKEATDLVTAGQHERSDDHGRGFKLNTRGPNGSYNDWLQERIAAVQASTTAVPNEPLYVHKAIATTTGTQPTYRIRPPGKKALKDLRAKATGSGKTKSTTRSLAKSLDRVPKKAKAPSNAMSSSSVRSPTLSRKRLVRSDSGSGSDWSEYSEASDDDSLGSGEGMVQDDLDAMVEAQQFLRGFVGQ